MCLLRYNNFVNLNDLQYILQHNCLVGINKAVVAGVSGGPDSLCMLDVLWRLGYPVIVAHINHGLRPQADEEANFVQQEALSRDLTFVQEKFDVRGYAQKNNLTIEEAARHVRYRFLFELARKSHAQAVAVGHTADDQVETVLMHLLRGSGLAGLGGMRYHSLPNSWDQEIALVRPLLGSWREEIVDYLKERCIQPVFDESNQDRQFFRNRLRYDLIPELGKYNPQIRRNIYKMAEVLRGDDELIQINVNLAWLECCVEQGTGYLGFAISSLRRQPLGLLRQLLRRGVKVLLPGLRDIDFEAIERGTDHIKSHRQGKIELTAGIYLLVEADRVWLATQEATLPLSQWPQVDSGMACSLDIPGERHLSGGWVLRTWVIDANDEITALAGDNLDQFQAWMDADMIRAPVQVRRRQKGDRLQPFGMGGHSVKLSDIMVNLKIPARARQGWPIIVSGEEIIWLPGYRIGEMVRLSPITRWVVHMELWRIEKS
jgi:tRNA(Ile)-lysidine synthase